MNLTQNVQGGRLPVSLEHSESRLDGPDVQQVSIVICHAYLKVFLLNADFSLSTVLYLLSRVLFFGREKGQPSREPSSHQRCKTCTRDQLLCSQQYKMMELDLPFRNIYILPVILEEPPFDAFATYVEMQIALSRT